MDRITCINQARDEWDLIEQVLKTYQNVGLWGGSSLGKTYTPLEVREGDRFPLTIDTAAAELRGHWMPGPGGFVWHNGPVTHAMVTGSHCVLDEIDLAGGDALSFLLAACDTTPQITLPSNETITPAHGYRITVTSNRPPRVLSTAMRDRFIWINVIWAHPNVLQNISYRFRNAAERDLFTPRESDEPNRLSVRDWMRLSQLTDQTSFQTAVWAVVGPERAEDFALSLNLGNVND